MTERDFDLCPSCGSFGQFGLRCHPKFSVKVGIHAVRMEDGGHPDMVSYYAHTLVAFKALVDWLRVCNNMTILGCERWDPGLKRWVLIYI